GRGDEVAEVELAHLTLGPEAELVAVPWGPGQLEARRGIDEGLAQVAVARLADFRIFDPQARPDRQFGAGAPGGLAEGLAAQLLNLDRGRRQRDGDAVLLIGRGAVEEVVGDLAAALEGPAVVWP